MECDFELDALPEDLRQAVDFHGHLCPGLMIGYRAALAGMEALGAVRSEDEELIAIVENDSCAVDAVQTLTGCTFGKGNLFFRDYGKQVYTFAARPSGKAVRVSLKSSSGQTRDGGGSQEKQRAARIKWLLNAPVEEIFDIRKLDIELPDSAEIHQSIICEHCGEKAMATRVREVGGKKLCIPCAESR